MNFPFLSFTRAKTVLIATCGFFISSTTLAQSGISTPEELKAACENSVGNTITLDQTTVVAGSAIPATPLVANCGCTVVITNDITFELQALNMRFTGPFSVQSAGKATFKGTNALLSAPSISFNLGGVGSELSMDNAGLLATAGNLTATLSAEPKVQLSGRFSTAFPNALSATGIVNITTGLKTLGIIAETGVSGNRGVQLNFSGTEASVEINKTLIRASAGSATIGSNGSKSILNMVETNFQVRANASIQFTGAETYVKMEKGSFAAATPTGRMSGGVTFLAAAGTAANGKVELIEVNSTAIGRNLSVTASPSGLNGIVKVEKNTFLNVGGTMLFSTGRNGNTSVVENSLSSAVRITIRTGTGGVCVSSPNALLAAPTVIACGITTTTPAARPLGTTATAIENQTPVVYPNPSPNGAVSVDFKNDFNTKSISLIDGRGATVQQWNNFNQRTLRINSLHKGMYTLRVLNADGSTTKPVPFLVIGN